MSFGSSSFGGFGANNQQNNNSLFGNSGGSGFGNNAGTGFGSSTTTPFGATNNANAGGSLFGGGASNTGGGFGSSTGGFGSNNQTQNQGSLFGQPRTSGFGSNTNTTNAGGSLFGGNQQASGAPFSGFGSNTNQQASSSGFGGASGGLFGSQNQSSSSGFGSNTNNTTGGGLFGSGNTTGGFGASTSGGFGAAASSSFGSTQQNNGTASTPFSPHTEKDPAGGANQLFQSITCMQPYQNFSFEELRSVDYQQGRQYGNQSGQAGAFGSNTNFGQGFGANTPNNSSNVFNTGTTNTTNTAGAFGSNTTSGFGGSTAFGSNNSTTTAGGLFGQGKSGGIFGNNASSSGTTTGGLFNSTNNSTGFGGANTGGTLFGSNQNQNQTKPTIFGNNTTGTTGFGANATTNTNPFGSTPAGNNPFGGGQSNSPFGQQTATNQSGTAFGGFGNNQQTQNQNGLFGGSFNNNNANKGFGATATGSAGLFGNQTQNSQQSNSLFGSAGFGQQNNQQNQNNGIFGQNKPATAANPFSQPAANNTNPLFNNLNTQQNQAQANNPFGGTQQKPLFGTAAPNNNSTGLFGNLGAASNNAQQSAGASLFGPSQSTNQGAALSNSLFASTNQQQQSQQPQYLTASLLTSNPYGNEGLFTGLATPQQPVGPLATPLSSSQKPRKPTPLAQWKINPSASTRLITPQKRGAAGTGGYGFSYSTYGTPGSAFSSPLSGSLQASTSRALSKSLSTSNLRSPVPSGESILSPDAFTPGSRSLRGTGSLRKLNINRNLRTDIFSSANPLDGLKASPLKKTVSFDNEKDQASTSIALVRTQQQDEEVDGDRLLRSSTTKRTSTESDNTVPEIVQVQGNELAIVPENGVSNQSSEIALVRIDHTDKDLGPYYMKPSKSEIDEMSREEKSHFENFIVGRIDAGEISFSKVDLNTIDLDNLFDEIVVFRLRTATVYPDISVKPKEGSGLNVPARITLDNSFPRSKGGLRPVYETKGLAFEKHLARLRRIPGTRFVEYRAHEGRWVFDVDHFSTYALIYDDDSFMSDPPGAFHDIGASALRNSTASSRFDDSIISNEALPSHIFGDEVSPVEPSLPGAFHDVPQTVMEQSATNRELRPDSPTTPTDGQMQQSEAEDSNISNGLRMSNGLDGAMDMDDPKHSPSSAALVRPRSIMKPASRAQHLATPRKGGAVASDDWAQQLQRTLSPKKQDRQALRIVQGSLLRPQPFTTTSPDPFLASQTENAFATSIDVMNSLFGGGDSGEADKHSGKSLKWPYAKRARNDENDMSDNEIAFHNSFKPAWSTNGILINGARLETTGHNVTNARGGGSKIEIEYANAVSLVDGIASAAFNRQRNSSNIEIESGVPRAQLASDFTFTGLASRLANFQQDSTAIKEEQIVWQLAGILFDDAQDTISLERKQKLSAFWRLLVEQESFDQASKCSSAEEKAIAFLAGGLVNDATEVLDEGRDYRLAAMVAQIGAGARMRSALRSQLDHWRDNDTLAESSLPIRALYELLAGNVCSSQGKSGSGPENNAETFTISSKFNLSWRQSFGLRLWYGIEPVDAIQTAVNMYSKDLTSGDEPVLPRPWFKKPGDLLQSGSQDILWGLLQLYSSHEDAVNANLGDILAPGNTSSSATDARLPFQLYHALRVHDIADFDGDSETRNIKADQLATSLVLQLSGNGEHLVDAVFVALHLSQPGARATCVKQLLERHAASIGDGKEGCPTFKTLVEELRVPESWLWSAKAMYAKAVLNDESAQVRYLLRAGETVAAHEILCDSVAPRAVIEEEFDSLKSLLTEIESTSLSAVDWQQGGALFKEFIAILEMPVAKPERKARARALLEDLPRPEAKKLHLEARAAFWEMRRVLTQMSAEGEKGAAKAQGHAMATRRREARMDSRADETAKLSESYYSRLVMA